MNEKVIEFIGYHGTDYSGEQGILNKKQFKASEKDDEWIGHGVYFFHSSEAEKHAEEWARNVKRFKFYSIMTTKINVSEKEVLDLNNEDYQDLFNKYREAKLKEYKSRNIQIPMDEMNAKKLDCLMINDLSNKGGFSLVCQRRYIELRERKDRLIASNIPNCNIMCVRDQKIIDKESIKCLRRGTKK